MTKHDSASRPRNAIFPSAFFAAAAGGLAGFGLGLAGWIALAVFSCLPIFFIAQDGPDRRNLWELATGLLVGATTVGLVVGCCYVVINVHRGS
ncbi:MAG: hypothetical protein RL885_06170 [Planctomycetota bacterium]